LGLSLITLAALALFVWHWNRFQASEAEFQAAQNQHQVLLRQKVELMELQRRARELQTLWAEVDNADIMPQRWYVFPLNVGRRLTWPEVDGLLLLVSQSTPDKEGLYFKPSQLRISRMLPEGGHGAAVPAGPPAKEDQADQYEVDMSGTFYIRKQIK
jgi:hypothetical protein